jgi:hypothetical protein
MRAPPKARRAALRCATALVVVAVGAVFAGCDNGTSSSARPSSTASTQSPSSSPSTPYALAVTAVREPLTTDASSPVVHDNEVMALTPHAGRLFAATDQWEYPGPNGAGQVLVKDTASGAWQVFVQTQSLRVQALDSFAIPRDQGLGSGHSLLITQAIISGRSELQWLVDNAPAFAPRDAFTLPSAGVDVRSFGAHEDGGVWSVYAGANPTGILRGTWSSRTHTLVFDPKPELTAAPPVSEGLKTQKVTGFADCGGALYVSINTKLYRRNDGRLPSGVARWQLVYRAPPVGVHNSGLRGLTCVDHGRMPALLVSTEGTGNVYRIDHLPTGRLANGAPMLEPTLEFAPIPAIRRMLAEQGTAVPERGKGSIVYVIAAYNNFTTLELGGAERQLFGFEWAYLGACAAGRRCGPTTASGRVTFDAAACFVVRTDRASSPTFQLHCLSGPDFEPVGRATKPIRARQAFVSIRTIQPSPFGDDQLYYGGYDCNFYPADGTAWIASSSQKEVRLGVPSS